MLISHVDDRFDLIASPFVRTQTLEQLIDDDWNTIAGKKEQMVRRFRSDRESRRRKPKSMPTSGRVLRKQAERETHAYKPPVDLAAELLWGSRGKWTARLKECWLIRRIPNLCHTVFCCSHKQSPLYHPQRPLSLSSSIFRSEEIIRSVE